MRPPRHVLPAALVCGLLAAPVVAQAAPASPPLVRPVTTFPDAQFGRVLATRSG